MERCTHTVAVRVPCTCSRVLLGYALQVTEWDIEESMSRRDLEIAT